MNSAVRAGVIDDVEAEARSLASMLKASQNADISEVALFSSAVNLIESLRSGQPYDILFVDVKLKDADGVDLAARLTEAGFASQVVFVSGYDTYHTRVYRTHHTAYLKKPYRQNDVDEALRLVNLTYTAQGETPLTIRHKGVVDVVQLRDISYIESSLRMLKIYTKDAEYEMYGKISDLTTQLPERFVRCHQSFILNLDAVESLDATEAHLVDGHSIPVSRRMRTQVRKALLNHIRKNN